MLWTRHSIEDVLDDLQTDFIFGLNQEQAEGRLSKYGRNEFKEQKKVTLPQKILLHLLEIPTLIILAAAIIAGYTAIIGESQAGNPSWPTVIIILIIVVINIVLGIWQEAHAEKAVEALKKINPYRTTVLRDGGKLIIDPSEIVPGDIIELMAGDVITADARIIEASALQTDESALTGESQPVEKDPLASVPEDAPLSDRLNMVYSGSLVTNGRAVVVVVETGMKTEMGKIAQLLNTTKKLKTPLQMRLGQLAKRIALVALVAGVLMFAFAMFIHDINPLTAAPRDMADTLFLAVALGAATVPGTLPIIVTMVLSFGVYNMVRKNTIIRKKNAVETVGNTSVICAEKTGTLTCNQMHIQKLWHVGYDPVAIKDGLNEDQRYMVELLASCSNATITISADEGEYVTGDPTEIAIIRLLHDMGLTRVDAEREYPRVYELPFDSTRKCMTTMHRIDGGYLVVTKGAFDHLPISWVSSLHKRATQIHDSFTAGALRCIAVSYKIYVEKPTDLSPDELESNQEFLGIVGMIDPPRPEIATNLRLAKQAGIRTIMMTGDHLETAKATAREIGIFRESDEALTGTDLTLMDERELGRVVKDVSIYASVSPEDKVRIVQAWGYHGAVVTMVGDGVNNAPALKAADVGIAMGIADTEVSKNAADIVITSDNFATVVDTIAVGRTSYDNIRKVISLLLSVNFAEIFILLAGMLVVGVSPLLVLQILLINVVSCGIPGLFMAFEKPEPGIMKRKPLPKGSGIFAARLGASILRGWASFSLLSLGAFWLGAYHIPAPGFMPNPSGAHYAIGITMAFVVLSWASVINIFVVRSRQSIFKNSPLNNMGMLLAACGAILFTLAVALVPPIAEIFGVVTGLTLTHWAIMVGFALLQLVFGEVWKLIADR